MLNLVQILGAVMVGIGVSTLTNGFKYFKMLEVGSFDAPPKLMIAIGVIMFLVAFLGCCGAWTENHHMIMAVRRQTKISNYW
jgi:hypothetical protein